MSTPRIEDDYTSYDGERSSVPVSPISASDSVRSIYTDLESSIDEPPPLKQNGTAKTVEDSLESMWSIVDMVCEEIAILQTKDETKYHAQKHLAAHAKRLRVLSQMHKQSIAYEKVQQMTQLGLLMEMKLYLEMLRDIEELGKNAGWTSDPLLREVQNIIYKETDMFKLAKQSKR